MKNFESWKPSAPAGLSVMQTGRIDTLTMQGQTKYCRACGEASHQQQGLNLKIMKTNYCFQGAFTRNAIRMRNIWLQKKDCYPSWISATPTALSYCPCDCRLLKTNGIKRVSDALFRAPLDLTLLPWYFKRKGDDNNKIEDSKEIQV